MQHADQHIAAIKKSLRVKNEVSTAFYDDKIREMGTVTVSTGKISISLYHLPSMVSEDATRDMVIGSIKLALEECWAKHSEAFDPHRS